MNKEYLILGGIFWRLWKKKIAFWYNHQYGNLITKIAGFIANVVFHTSPFAFTAKFKNAKIMPAGIDTETFKRYENIQRIPNSILYLGRISPIKNVDVLIEAANLLDREGIKFVLNIVGEPGEKDKEYFEKIKKIAENLEEKGKIKFLGKVPNYKTPEIYNRNKILVNLSPSGLFDKTILEAMACQTLVVVSSDVFQNILPDFLIFREKNSQDLKDKIINIFNMKREEKENLGKKLRMYVTQNHNLEILVEKIKNELIKS
jgi:glycosyltransferase involved in cell wall biosynthesis